MLAGVSSDEIDPKAAQRAYEAKMVRSAAHPVRAKALEMMSERPTSPKEVAEAVGKPIGNVTYHVQALEEGDMVVLVDEKKRGGATEHFYLATTIDEDAARRLTPAERKLLMGRTLHLVIGDAALAVEAGTLSSRPDTHLTRAPLYLDEEGWREIGEIYERAHAATLEAQARAADRLDRGGAGGFRALAAMMLFEMAGKPERD